MDKLIVNKAIRVNKIHSSIDHKANAFIAHRANKKDINPPTTAEKIIAAIMEELTFRLTCSMAFWVRASSNCSIFPLAIESLGSMEYMVAYSFIRLTCLSVPSRPPRKLANDVRNDKRATPTPEIKGILLASHSANGATSFLFARTITMHNDLCYYNIKMPTKKRVFPRRKVREKRCPVSTSHPGLIYHAV